MAKKPFSIRVEESVTHQYRALAAVLNVDSAKLLSELINLRVQNLNDEQKTAYDALMRAWSVNK